MRKLGSNSSSSEDYENRAAVLDEKKKRRMLSNRESARRSRMKRQQYIQDLNEQVVYLSARNGEIDSKCRDMTERYAGMESENRKLRKQGEELKRKLAMLEEALDAHRCDSFLQDILGEEPWLQIQPPFQSQAVDGS